MSSPEAADEWFVLVTAGEPPAFNVVPRNHVVAAIRVFQAIQDAQQKPWSRKLLGEQEFDRYRGAWDLLECPAFEADWRMPPWVTDGLKEHPQPDLTGAPSN